MYASVKTIKAHDRASAMRVADYYTSAQTITQLSAEDLAYLTGYYGADKAHGGTGELPSIARFSGQGAVELGFAEGEIATRGQVFQLLQGIDPNFGTPLRGLNAPGRPPTVSAIDATFAMEKDASVLCAALGVEGAKFGEEALQAGVDAAIRYLEEEGAVVRRGKDGVVHKQSAGLIAIRTTHFTARPVDGEAEAHMHQHVVIINNAKGPDGRRTALDGQRLFALQTTAGAIAGAVTRQMIAERFGVEWEPEATRDGHLAHRIVGFPSSVRDDLSGRQRQIHQAMRDQMVDKHAGQRMTKEAKTGCGGVENWTAITERMEAADVTFGGLISACQQEQERRRLVEQQALSDAQILINVLGEAPTGNLELRDWKLAAARYVWRSENEMEYGLNGYKNAELDFDRVDRALDAETVTPTELIHRALNAVGQARSTFQEQHLIRAACDAGLTLHDAQAHVARFVSGGRAIAIWGIDRGVEDLTYPEGTRVRWNDQALYATRETLDAEQRFFQATLAGVGARDRLVTARQFQKILDTMAKSGKVIDPGSDQYDMLRHILRGQNAISIITGQAGTGKSAGFEALAIVAEGLGLLKRSGPQVLGCSLGSLAAQNLMQESGIKSMSITMMLSRLDHGAIQLQRGAIIVVDEASQGATYQLDKLRAHVEAVEGRLIAAGDWRQLQAVEAGGLFRDIAQKIPQVVSRLDEIRRQETFEERVILSVLHDQGDLSKQSLAALERQSKALYGSTVALDAVLGKYFATSRELPTGEMARVMLPPSTAVEGALQWYKDNKRLRFVDTPEEAATGIAADYWDDVERGLKRGLTAERAQLGSLNLVPTNAASKLINDAIMDEGRRRGHFSPTVIDFGGHQLHLGQRITYRAIKRNPMDPSQEMLNGHSYVVDGIVDAPVCWTLKVKMPFGPVWDREFSGVEVPDKVAISLTPRQVAEVRKSADEWLAKCKRVLANSTKPESRQKWTRELRIARASARAAHALPGRGGDVVCPVLEKRDIQGGRRLAVHLDDGSRRYLEPEDMDSTSPGYVGTTQVLQGQTTDYASPLGMGYVGLTRARKTTTPWIVTTPEKLARLQEGRDQARGDVERLVRSLGGNAPYQFLQMASQVVASQPGNQWEPATTTVMVAQTVAGVKVTMGATPADIRNAAATDLANRYVAALKDPEVPRAMGVAKNRAMADDLNVQVLTQLAAKGVVGAPFHLNGQTFAIGAPVIVTHTVKSLGFTENTEALVTGYDPERGLAVLTATGRHVTLSPTQVERHLVPGLVTTAHRAPHLGADDFVSLGAGLVQGRLDALKDAGNLAVYVSDPEAAYEAAVKDLRWETALSDLRRDAFGDTHLSAHREAWNRLDEEPRWKIGLPSLQEQYRQATLQLDKYKGVEDPVELAKRVVQDRIISSQRDLKAARDLVREQERQRTADRVAGEPEEEHHREPDSVERLKAHVQDLETKIAAEQERLGCLIDRQPVLDDDLQAAREQERQSIIDQEHLTEEARRVRLEAELNDVERAIARNVAIRLSEVEQNPPPYLPKRPGVEAGPEGLTQWRADLGDIENYRMRWGVPDEAPTRARVPETNPFTDPSETPTPTVQTDEPLPADPYADPSETPTSIPPDPFTDQSELPAPVQTTPTVQTDEPLPADPYADPSETPTSIPPDPFTDQSELPAPVQTTPTVQTDEPLPADPYADPSETPTPTVQTDEPLPADPYADPSETPTPTVQTDEPLPADPYADPSETPTPTVQTDEPLPADPYADPSETPTSIPPDPFTDQSELPAPVQTTPTVQTDEPLPADPYAVAEEVLTPVHLGQGQGPERDAPEQPSVVEGPAETESIERETNEELEPLGPKPLGGRQAEEYDQLMENLGDRYPNIAGRSEGAAARTPEVQQPAILGKDVSFHTVGNGYTLRGPVGSFPPPGTPVTVTRKNGKQSTVLITSTAREITVKGEPWMEVEFNAEWGVGTLEPNSTRGSGRGTRQQWRQEQLDKLIHEREKEFRARMQIRAPEPVISISGPSLF